MLTFALTPSRAGIGKPSVIKHIKSLETGSACGLVTSLYGLSVLPMMSATVCGRILYSWQCNCNMET